MLNGKKILSVCGAVALLLGVGMNLRHSLNDYGMGTNSLSTFALAQTSSSSGSGSSSSTVYTPGFCHFPVSIMSAPHMAGTPVV